MSSLRWSIFGVAPVALPPFIYFRGALGFLIRIWVHFVKGSCWFGCPSASTCSVASAGSWPWEQSCGSACAGGACRFQLTLSWQASAKPRRRTARCHIMFQVHPEALLVCVRATSQLQWTNHEAADVLQGIQEIIFHTHPHLTWFPWLFSAFRQCASLNFTFRLRCCLVGNFECNSKSLVGFCEK